MTIRERVGLHSYGSGTQAQLDYARGLGCKVFQVFLGNPQRYWCRKEEPGLVSTFQKSISDKSEIVIAHANYLINLADDVNSRNWKMSLKSLENIVEACKDRGIELLVAHSGSEKGRGLQAAIDSWKLAVQGIQGVQICVENNAYKGNIFSDLDNLAKLADGAGVGVCIDSAHMWSAGYGFDGSDYDKLLSMKDKIKVIHLNQHPGPKGANKDRHSVTALPDGQIPFEAYAKLLRDFDVPFIMELEGNPELIEKSFKFLESLQNG